MQGIGLSSDKSLQEPMMTHFIDLYILAVFYSVTDSLYVQSPCNLPQVY